MKVDKGPVAPFEQEIADALREAVDEMKKKGYETGSVGQALLRTWFKEDRGEALFFVFRKNLKVTNLQFAELLALISAYTVDRESKASPGQLQFVSSDDFSETVNGLIAAFPPKKVPRNATRKQRAAIDAEHREQSSRWFAQQYSHLLQNTLLVDPFHASCAVYVPKHLFVDLRRICALSGYIHACGRNIFVRNVEKATREHFQTALDIYLSRYRKAKPPVLFSAYAHEDFDTVDRHDGRSTHTRDLDDLKIHVEKFFIGGEHLVDVLSALGRKFKGKIVLPGPGNVLKQRNDMVADDEIDPERTVWLLSDYGALWSGQRSNDRYFICYEQIFHNRGPFEIFDENKPGWVEHTTIPHTLMAAMINLTLPHWSDRKKVLLADPFAGTGTTWLEASKHREIEPVTSDLDSLAAAAAVDNARFFALSVDRLTELAEVIKEVIEHYVAPAARPRKFIRGIVAKIKWWSAGADEQRKLADRMSDDLTERLVYYLALRTNKRHAVGLTRAAKQWEKAFQIEGDALLAEIRHLIEARERSGPSQFSTHWEAPNDDGVIVDYHGHFSRNVTLSPSTYVDLPKSRNLPKGGVRAESIADTKPRDGYDLIVTDPPYGFNTDEEPRKLAATYVDFLKGALDAIADGGQLVLCLPERSNIGKTPLAFTHRSVITHQIISLARERNLEVVPTFRTAPGRGLFSPPFYWESERALRRSILHFRFRRQHAA